MREEQTPAAHWGPLQDPGFMQHLENYSLDAMTAQNCAAVGSRHAEHILRILWHSYQRGESHGHRTNLAVVYRSPVVTSPLEKMSITKAAGPHGLLDPEVLLHVGRLRGVFTDVSNLAFPSL